jgi:hypothetical protein
MNLHDFARALQDVENRIIGQWPKVDLAGTDFTESSQLGEAQRLLNALHSRAAQQSQIIGDLAYAFRELDDDDAEIDPRLAEIGAQMRLVEIQTNAVVEGLGYVRGSLGEYLHGRKITEREST